MVSCGYSCRVAHVTPGMLDTIYFSAITQLTIGYGEITPTGLGKLLAPGQAVFGTMLLVVGVARLLAGVKAPTGGAPIGVRPPIPPAPSAEPEIGETEEPSQTSDAERNAPATS